MELHSLLLAVLCSLASAQSPRARILGKAIDRKGEPWAGARIVFVAAKDQSPDRVETTTDERGRFRADLMPRRLYSVWAEADGERSKRRYSNLLADVGAPSPPLVLRERDKVMDVQRVAIRGVAGWKQRAPFRVRAVDLLYCGVPEKQGLAFEIDGDQLSATLPHAPVSAAYVKLYDKDGRLLLDELVERTAWRRTTVVALTAPTRFEVRVRDSASSKPIAGARVFLPDEDRLIALATSGADGKAGLEVPERLLGGFHRQLCVAADGYEMGVCDRSRADQRVFEVGLKRGTRARGRIVLGANRPAASLQLLQTVYGTNWLPTGTYRAPYPQRATTNADGVFGLAHLQRYSSYDRQLTVRLSDAHLAALPDSVRDAVVPEVPIRLRSKAIVDSVIELADIDLSRYTPVEACIRRPSGEPVRGALFTILRAGRTLTPPLLRSRSDRHGRVAMLLPNHGELLLSVTDRGAWALQRIVLDTDTRHATPIAISVILPEALTISGTVLDPTGKPVANLEVSYTYVGDRDKDGVALVEVPDTAFGASEADPGVRTERAGRELVAYHQHRAISWTGSVRTDDKGRYRVRVPAYTGGLRLSVRRRFLFFKQYVSRLARIERGSLTDFDLKLVRQ